VQVGCKNIPAKNLNLRVISEKWCRIRSGKLPQPRWR
jgi:hypothetical protein